MPKMKPVASWLLPIAMLLLTACGPKQIRIEAAEPLPAPEIEAPETVNRPVERPSWMTPVVLMISTPAPVLSTVWWRSQLRT